MTVAPGSDVSVFVTYSGWDADAQVAEVDGYIGGLVESGGTCTLTLTKDGATAGTSREATPDAASTSCGALTVPRSELSPGTWSGVVTYESTASRGSSEPVQVKVP